MEDNEKEEAKKAIQARIDKAAKELVDAANDIAMLEGVGHVEIRLQAINVLGIGSANINVSLADVTDKEGNPITRENLEKSFKEFVEKAKAHEAEELKAKDPAAIANNALEEILGKRKNGGTN